MGAHHRQTPQCQPFRVALRDSFWWRRSGKSDEERVRRNARWGNSRPMIRPRWKHASASLGLGMLVLGEPALAADLPLNAPALRTVYDWTGFYVGGHFGYGGGSLGANTN